MSTEQREAKRVYDAARYQSHKAERLASNAAYRAAHPAYNRDYYAAHKDEKSAYAAAHKDEKLERDARQLGWFQGNLRTLRAAQGCDDCGPSERRLDHHHLDPSTKKYSIAHMYNNSFERFLDEVAKCTVLCRSCHKKRHAAMRHEGKVSA